MIDTNSNNFITALKTENLTSIIKVPKAERHTHMGLNGNKEFLFRRTEK